MSLEEQFVNEWFPDDDSDDFFLIVRINSRWEENKFTKMVATANAFIGSLEKEGLPELKRWDEAIINSINQLHALLLHPGYLAENELGLTKKEYEEFILERVNILEDIKGRYMRLKKQAHENMPGCPTRACS